MKKILVALLALAMVFTLVSCNKSSSSKVLVGVSMPTQSLQRWNQDGSNMVSQLKSAGYDSILQYANNDVTTQVQQIENMITKGCKILVIAAIDGSSMTDVLATAAKNNVKVIAYDRLIMQTPNVDYYATFDNYKVGQLQGKYIVDQLKLDSASGPFNIEIFAGSPDDNNAKFFFNGAMDVLKPYISSGKLVIKSGQKDFNVVAITSWTSATAQSRMDNLITANYANGTKLDAILSPNDSIAIGIVASLQSHNYGTADKPYPILTGQDCDKPNVKAVLAGQQSMSIFKDTRKLASETVTMITAMEKAQTPETNDSKTYNNGVKVVPTELLTPVFVDKSNYKSILIDSGYYKLSDIQ
ncbi:MAG: sugar ABC transporter substrate-binding protein [Clostridia bacterium]|nr:sugar ABC transporter substrate-binding protein [Clostridia bacterium]